MIEDGVSTIPKPHSLLISNLSSVLTSRLKNPVYYLESFTILSQAKYVSVTIKKRIVVCGLILEIDLNTNSETWLIIQSRKSFSQKDWLMRKLSKLLLGRFLICHLTSPSLPKLWINTKSSWCQTLEANLYVYVL